MNYLQWYRDKGRGQEAADYLSKHRLYKRKIIQTNDGAWPVARLFFADGAENTKMWKLLLVKFDVNAVSVYPCKGK